MERLLEGKVAVVYGAGGAIGAGVARTFAREGATVALVGRTPGPLDRVADVIVAEGGHAITTVLDATDEAAVDAHVDALVAETGQVDVSFNLISRGDVQGRPIIEMSTSDMLRATTAGLTSSFITARAAARHMVPQGSGVILHLNSGSGDGAHPGMGSTGPADAASESLMRYLATELGPAGVRVCGIWTAGVADTLTREKLLAVGGTFTPDPETVIAMISAATALKRAPVLREVAEVAAFLASDCASGMTGTMTNVTCGMVIK